MRHDRGYSWACKRFPSRGRAQDRRQSPFRGIHKDGEFFATELFCSHEDAPLEDGWLHDDCSLECPWHSARFDLRTGEALCGPAYLPIRVFRGEVWGDKVLVHVGGDSGEAIGEPEA